MIALSAVETAGIHFQIGFNRRYAADFRAAKKDLANGVIGMPQILRSLIGMEAWASGDDLAALEAFRRAFSPVHSSASDTTSGDEPRSGATFTTEGTA